MLAGWVEEDHWVGRGKDDHWVGRGKDDHWAGRGEFDCQHCEQVLALK